MYIASIEEIEEKIKRVRHAPMFSTIIASAFIPELGEFTLYFKQVEDKKFSKDKYKKKLRDFLLSTYPKEVLE
jgi:hypothetical protein